MKNHVSTRSLGLRAELSARKYLEKIGLHCLEQNYRCKVGEIDLIMQEKDTIVFIEVRSRHSDLRIALESIDPYKQQKITKTAEYYLQKKRYYDTLSCRFDVIAINQFEIEWVKDAFYADNF